MDDMVASKNDTYDIKLFQQVLEESRMMVPDSEKRLGAALEELQEYIGANDDTLEGEWMEAANLILADQDKKEAVEGNVPETVLDDLADGEAF
jgi:hypothetical protein